MSEVRIVGYEGPIVVPIAQMALMHEGVMEMAKWVELNRPGCTPETGYSTVYDLLPHDGTDLHTVTGKTREVSDNELLCELAGRKCYDSFAEAGKYRCNGDYLSSMWSGRIPHRSTGYHAKMSFFIANVSRRVSHELIRNYVGADRDEEGSPSQESTRFTHHPGVYIAPVRDLDDSIEFNRFVCAAEENYRAYRDYIRDQVAAFEKFHGASPKGMDRKRIYEAASNYLLHSCATSFIWTTNPMALAKFFAERDNEHADAEIQRFARRWKQVCFRHWPNLFPMTDHEGL